jgi:hypothetical protein
VSGAEESSGFRFTGSEGLMTVDKSVTLTTVSAPKEPGYSIGTFDQAEQEAFMKKYRQEYPQNSAAPGNMRDSRQETFAPPPRYSDHLDHHLNFASAIRSGKPVVEDAVFGFRAAAPAVLSNVSYFENRIVEWNPQTMKVKA